MSTKTDVKNGIKNDNNDEKSECVCKEVEKKLKVKSVGDDPRFQQQNQTLRCFVSYRDFYRCEHILGKGHEACTWFQDVFQEFCPLSWIEKWDEQRSKNLFVGATKDRKM